MRIATLFSIVVVASLSLVACGGGGGGGDDDGDDGDDAVEPDAMESEAKQIGDTCTPDAANPMGPGDCGAGMTCLSLQGGNGTWCSKTCTPGAGDTCADGYTGAGIPACVYGITFTQGGTPVNMCGVVCNDVAGDPVICDPATACNGTCPGTLQCSAPLNDMNNTHVADACI